MTAEDLIALPEEGIDRELIRGELRKRPKVYHRPAHSRTAATLVWLLGEWQDGQPEPHGEVLGYGAPFRLSRDPESLVGCDAAYISPEHLARTDDDLPFFEGPPVLAVEILDHSDEHGDVVEKVGLYLEAGSVVWVVDPFFHTVAVHGPDRPLEVFTERQELTMEPELPGFRVPVAKIFS
jgi:Uma2 family endonuclease